VLARTILFAASHRRIAESTADNKLPLLAAVAERYP
jgi:hypothetical protein